MPRKNNGAAIKWRTTGTKIGYYEAVWYEGTTKRRRSLGTSQLDEAQRKFAEWLATTADGDTDSKRSFAARPHERSLGEVLACYIDEHAPTLSVKGQISLATAMKRLLPWWADRTVEAVNKATCQAFAKAVGKQPFARQCLAYLKAALNHDWRSGRLLHPIPVWMPPAPAPRQRFLTRAEMAKLLWAARKHPEAAHIPFVLLLALYTGARTSAILGLRWPQVDERSGLIRLQQAGKGITNKRHATIPLHPRLRWVFRALRQRGTDLGHVIHINQLPLASVKRGVATACRNAGIPRLGLHTIRHTCASWMVQGGVPVLEVAQYLGTTPAMIVKHYGHLMPQHLTRAGAALTRKQP